tara:strand:+ start:582 stop:719 length:138 start_codon:yes stop_codon:yes gene_type:complete
MILKKLLISLGHSDAATVVAKIKINELKNTFLLMSLFEKIIYSSL